MGGLVDVVAAWFAGRPTENLEFLGQTMIFWGRLGKSMLYLAGLVILLDLADPRKLRQRGAASVAHADRTFGQMRRKRQVARLVRLQEAVRDSVAQTVPRRGLLLVSRPPTAVPAGLRLSLAEYRDFHEDVLTALPTKHTCQDRHDRTLCPQQFEYTMERINSLIAEHLPATEKDLVRDVEAVRNSVVPLLALTAAVVGSLCAVRQDRLWESGTTAVAVLLAVITLGVLCISAARVTIAATGYRIWGAVLAGYGRLLDQSRPLHLLRWVAAGLFLIGGPLDLLAS